MSNGIGRKIKLALTWGAITLLVLELVFCFFANIVLQSFDLFAYDGADDVELAKDGKIYSAWGDGTGSPAHTQKFEECTSQYINPPLIFLLPTVSEFGMHYGYAFSKWGAVEMSFDQRTGNVAGISFWEMNFEVYPQQFSDAFIGTQGQCSIFRGVEDNHADTTVFPLKE